MGLQADSRAAAVSFLSAYASDAMVKMQVYPGRPASIHPPTGFVDLIREHIDYPGQTSRQRTPVVEIVVIHGIFDSKDATTQKDAFTDGFLDWAWTRYHQAGANTLCAITDTEDLPNYVPEWMPPAHQEVYYATRITLEVLAFEG